MDRRTFLGGAGLAAMAVGLGTGIAPASAQGATAVAVLQPHRVAYEVSLGPKTAGQAISGARGLMVLEFTGNACDGYATNFRQVVDLLDSDGAARNMDFRVNLFEDGDGKRFRFAMLNRMQGQVLRDSDGEARRRADGSLSVAMKKPAGQKTDFDGDVLFPSALAIDMIAAARKGARTYRGKVFDGSEGGEQIYDVHVTIGAPMEVSQVDRVEEVLRVPALEKVGRWPVVMTYFKDEPGDRVPAYTLRAVAYENGVMGNMVFEFPDFSLGAKAVRYENLRSDACQKP